MYTAQRSTAIRPGPTNAKAQSCTPTARDVDPHRLGLAVAVDRFAASIERASDLMALLCQLRRLVCRTTGRMSMRYFWALQGVRYCRTLPALCQLLGRDSLERLLPAVGCLQWCCAGGNEAEGQNGLTCVRVPERETEPSQVTITHQKFISAITT